MLLHLEPDLRLMLQCLRPARLRHAVCSKVKVGKQLCSLEPIIGQPYGSVYQIAADTSELVRTKRYTGHCGCSSELCLDSWRIFTA